MNKEQNTSVDSQEEGMTILPPDPTLRGKLEEIARLEREHGIVGVSILPKEGQGPILTRDVADHVIAVIKEGVEVMKNRDQIPTAEEACNPLFTRRG